MYHTTIKKNCLLRVFVFAIVVCVCGGVDAQGETKARDARQTLNDPTAADTMRVDAYLSLGNAVLASDPQQATTLTDSALMLSRKVKWISGIARAYRQMGVLSMNKADNDKALAYFQMALREAEVLHNEKFTSTIYINTGMIYLNIEEYPQAIASFKTALAYGLKINEPVLTSYSYNNIGIGFLRMKEADSCIYYLTLGAPVAEANHLDNVLTRSYSNIGAALDLKGNYRDAITYYDKGMAKAMQIGDMESQALATVGLAEAYTSLKEYDKAKLHCNEAIELGRQMSYIQYQKEGYNMLADIYAGQQHYDSALKAYKSYIILRDSMNNDEKKADIVKRDMQYKSEKEQALASAEISRQVERKNISLAVAILILLGAIGGFILYKRNRDTQQRERETTAMLRLKDTELKALRLQINPHFIGNTLQSVQHFINSHQGNEAEEYLIKFSSLMRSMLVNSEQEEIPLSREMEALEWYMQLENLRMNYPFVYHIRIGEGIDADSVYLPPNLLQPFVENSIKHGLSPKGSAGNIYIDMKVVGGELHITIEDDGVGRDKNKQRDLPMQLRHESMGIKITRERLDLLNQSADKKSTLTITDLIENDQPKGTRVTLIIPYLS